MLNKLQNIYISCLLKLLYSFLKTSDVITSFSPKIKQLLQTANNPKLPWIGSICLKIYSQSLLQHVPPLSSTSMLSYNTYITYSGIERPSVSINRLYTDYKIDTQSISRNLCQTGTIKYLVKICAVSTASTIFNFMAVRLGESLVRTDWNSRDQCLPKCVAR